MEASKVQIVGDKLPNMYQVKLELSDATDRFSSLFFFFTEMWLMCNCKSAWYMERLGKHPVDIIISFQDPKEAIFFKLSKQFDRASQDRDSMQAFVADLWLKNHKGYVLV